jgi:hypothetical protein
VLSKNYQNYLKVRTMEETPRFKVGDKIKMDLISLIRAKIRVGCVANRITDDFAHVLLSDMDLIEEEMNKFK